ncbi:hypothetical protein [Dactylosporangium sp. NPDC000521]|uniref:hypothetical protein n=1 Tax=Dactylosporangium sp. NPDC000521 TaxID=3363975 RepID=UPI00367706DE
MTEARPMRELAPHLVWEAVLLLAAGAVAAGLLNAHAAVFSRGQSWPGIAILGFAACGLALSLRTATPNLAIGSIAVLAGWVYAGRVNDGTPVPAAFLVAVLAAFGVGVVLALLTGLTALPAWAVTLGGGFVVSAVLLKVTEGRLLQVTGAHASGGFGWWVTVFVAGSIAGAVLFALPAARRGLTANRPSGAEDPARWRPAKLTGALVGVAGSAALAGVAGVLSTRLTSAAVFTESGQLPFALAAVLLGGVSVFGRRAGVFGVVLGVFIVDGVRRWQLIEGVPAATTLLTTGLLAVVGLLAVWLLELVGRRVAPLAAAPAASDLVPPPAAPGFAPPAAPGFAPPPVYDVSPPLSGPSGPSGIPAQSTGFPAPPAPTSGGPVFGQPAYPSQPPASGPPQQYPGVIPQPWTVPGAGGPAPQVPSQPVSPPVSGPPNSDPPAGYPQNPPPAWPPQN